MDSGTEKVTAQVRGFTVSAQITGCRPLADGGMSINFHTKELDSKEMSVIIDHYKNDPLGWLLFRANEIKEEEIPKEDADIEPRTNSEILKGKIFKHWDAKGRPGEFSDFYKARMKSHIQLEENKI